MDPRLTRNAFLFLQGALFAVLFAAAMAALYLPGPVMLLLAIVFCLSGLALMMLTARLEEMGAKKLIFMLTGASAAAIPLAAILHNLMPVFILQAFFFVQALFILPAIFAIGWLCSVVLLGTTERPIPRRRRNLMIGLVSALVVAIAVTTVLTWQGEGYAVTSEVVNAPDQAIERVFVTARVDEALMPVFWHSFEHSLVSAFASNDVDVTVEMIRAPNDPVSTEQDVEAFAPDATMLIGIEPLYRSHRDGYEAVVGTVFEAALTDTATGERAWHLSGKVDYIADAFFNSHGYTAHEGVIKEFAWHTTAAVVRTFMVDVEGRQSVPIYTVTEARQRHGQRID